MGELEDLRIKIRDLTLKIVKADIENHAYSELLQERNRIACRIGELKQEQASDPTDLAGFIENKEIEMKLKEFLVSKFPEHEKRVIELAEKLISESKIAQFQHLRGCL